MPLSLLSRSSPAASVHWARLWQTGKTPVHRFSSFSYVSSFDGKRRRFRWRYDSDRSSSSSRTKANGTGWPASFRDFVAGDPITTRSLPYLGSISIDFGTVMMNVGAITSLGGFCMTDVLLLRSLSIVGSACGVIYNVTRVPKQINAVMWGAVFIGVNVVQIVRLLVERVEVKLNVEEGELYYRLFAPFGVDVKVFANLLKHAEWKTYEKGQVIVPKGKPLKRVHLLVQGTAECVSKNNDHLYSYTATDNGCIIGATAVVDPAILGRNYPNEIRASEGPVRALSFHTEALRTFLKQNDSTAEAAILHLMYVDLLGALRRDRKMGEALQELKALLQQHCGSKIVNPRGRRAIREFVEENNISNMQFKSLLQSVGWTEQEWKDGAKHSSQAFRAQHSDASIFRYWFGR